MGYRRLQRGAYFGELAAIDGLPRSVNIVAMTDARIVRMPATLVRRLLDECPAFARALLEDLAVMVRGLSNQLFDQNVASAACRLRIELLRMATTAGIVDDRAAIPVVPTHAAMAAFIGTQRELVTREFNRLKTARPFVRSGQTLVVPRVSALRDDIVRLGGEIPNR